MFFNGFRWLELMFGRIARDDRLVGVTPVVDGHHDIQIQEIPMTLQKMLSRSALAALATGLALPSVALAVPMTYTSNLTPLNGSGVSGQADLSLEDNLLTVRIQAEGLVPGQIHPQHIHGRFDETGAPRDSVTPTPDLDADGDGFIEVAEGALAYGPILLPLTSPPGGALENFPTAEDGTLDFTQVYDLNDSSIFNADFMAEDLFALDLREIVLHGLTLAEGVGMGTPNEVNGEGGYNPLVPIASGEITAVDVPEPGSLALLAGGLTALGAGSLSRRRKSAQKH